MKYKTWEEITTLWRDYQPLREVDPLFTSAVRFKPHVLEGRIQRVIDTMGKDNQLRRPLLGRRNPNQEVADLFQTLLEWDYFQRQPREKQSHLYRLIVVAGYFIGEEHFLPEMKKVVMAAEQYLGNLEERPL